MKESILIITSSGGGGLLQLAHGVREELLEKNPQAKIVVCDVLKDWSWPGFGRFCIWFYNFLQRQSFVKLLELVVSLLPYAEKIIWLSVYLNMKKLLKKHHFTRIISTQCLAPSPIIKAIKATHLSIKLEIMAVDLPTPKAFHFFDSIKKLSSADRAYIEFITAPPLLDHNQTKEQFWLYHCALPITQIKEIPYFIRKGFVPYVGQHKSMDMDLGIGFSSFEEQNLLSSLANKEVITQDQGKIFYHVKKEDKVFVILLGSQAAKKATIDYVKNFLTLFKKEPLSSHIFLFAFCPTSDMQNAIKNLVTEKAMGEKIIVCPMSFQKDGVIAKLFFRADLSLTKSGGQTVMELMAVSKAKFLIHSGAKIHKQKKLSKKELIQGIPAWEAGNALYLEKKYDARIVTPELILDTGYFLT